MPRLSVVLFVLVLMVLLAGCVRGPALSDAEEAAVDRLVRDLWADLIRVERLGPDSLKALTRQGDETIAYRITFSAEGDPQYERLPRVSAGPWGRSVNPDPASAP